MKEKLSASFQKASTSYIKKTNVVFSPVVGEKFVTLRRPATSMGVEPIKDTKCLQNFGNSLLIIFNF